MPRTDVVEQALDLRILARAARGRDAPIAMGMGFDVMEPQGAERAAPAPPFAAMLTNKGVEQQILELIGLHGRPCDAFRCALPESR